MSKSELLFFTEHGAGPALLLVHGLMVSGEMFQPVVEPLAAHHRLIVPDLRGHAHSRNLLPPYTPAQLAADLGRLLDHLDVESAVVLGYSQGGAVAQQFVLDYPQRCERLVLGCTYAYNMATTREWIEGHIAPLMLRLLGLRRMANLAVSQSMLKLDPERARWLEELLVNQDLDLMVAAWKEMTVFDSRKRLGEIHCPTLIIAGEKDQGVPSHHARMLNEGIPGSRLVMVEGADHSLIWTHTQEFLKLVEEFMGQ